MSELNDTIGIIGAGSFGTAIAELAAHNRNVILFSRRKEVLKSVNEEHFFYDTHISKKIVATNDVELLVNTCKTIFLVVPSVSFSKMIKSIAPYLKPDHILIHGTKGFNLVEGKSLKEPIGREHIQTMSELIKSETDVIRCGCLSGPNLAKEIMEGLPTATLIASTYDEVIDEAKSILSSERFHIFGSHKLFGAELAGTLKNSIAVGTGILAGKGLGKNIEAMLITRGLSEMIYIGNALGANTEPFLGTAGIADLIATATSIKSRNYSFGYALGQGQTFDEVKANFKELAEGLRTIQIMRQVGRKYKLHIPITDMLYKIVFDGYDIEKAISFLMLYPYSEDVDYI